VAAVCAVRLHHLPSGEQHYLLVKRPENGLLAGDFISGTHLSLESHSWLGENGRVRRWCTVKH